MLKTIVITAGGTSEKIDDVRTITNMSTGKLGATICNTLLSQISEQIEIIYYICSDTTIRPEQNPKVKVILVKGTYDLKNNVEKLLKSVKVNFFIHSMAVSDYTTDYVSTSSRLADEIVDNVWEFKDTLTKEALINLVSSIVESPKGKISTDKKMSSSENGMFIKLKQTPKVISIIKDVQSELKLIGFKLLSDVTEEELIKVASNLMLKNKCDYVVANDLAKIRKGKHDAIILDKEGEILHVSGKDAIANVIVDIIKK